VAQQHQHVAEVVADEQVELAVAVGVGDRQAGGQVSGTQLEGPAVCAAGNFLSEAAVAVAEKDRDIATLLIQDRKVEVRRAGEMAGNRDCRTEPRSVGLGGRRVQEAALSISCQDRKAVSPAVDGDQVAAGTAAKIAGDQTRSSLA